MTGPLRLALIGLGKIAASHLAALERIQGVEVVAGVNPDPARDLTFRGRRGPCTATSRRSPARAWTRRS